MQWTSKTTYVDVETGEQKTKKQIEKYYTKLKCEIKHEKRNDIYGIKHILWKCERNRQTKLF